MTEIDKIVDELRSAPSSMLGTDLEPHYWSCQKAADLIIRLRQHVNDLKLSDSRFAEKRERNLTILQRRNAGERTTDLANEYGVSLAMISKIVQRERDRIRKKSK